MNRCLICAAIIAGLFIAGCPETKVEPAAAEPAKESAEKPKGPLDSVRNQLDQAGAKANERLDRASEVNE